MLIVANRSYADIFDAVNNGDLDGVREYVVTDIDINSKNSYGLTVLTAASILGEIDIVKYLLGKDADINIENKDGFTALMLASKSGQLEVVKYLVDK